MNNFVICIAIIWGCAAIGTFRTKSDGCIVAAMYVTIFMGGGYLILRIVHS